MIKTKNSVDFDIGTKKCKATYSYLTNDESIFNPQDGFVVKITLTLPNLHPLVFDYECIEGKTLPALPKNHPHKEKHSKASDPKGFEKPLSCLDDSKDAKHPPTFSNAKSRTTFATEQKPHNLGLRQAPKISPSANLNELQFIFACANILSELASAPFYTSETFCIFKSYTHLPQEAQYARYSQINEEFKILQEYFEFSKQKTYTLLLNAFSALIKELYTNDERLSKVRVNPQNHINQGENQNEK